MMIRRTQLAALGATLLTCSAWYNAVKADQGDSYLYFHGISSHLNADGWYSESATSPCGCHKFTPYREFNPGLGLGYEVVNYIEARAGFFLNSYDRTSLYTGINWHTTYARPLSVGFQAGLVTGYENTPATDFENTKLTGYVLPTVRGNADGFSIEMGFIPALGGNKGGLITLSFAVQF